MEIIKEVYGHMADDLSKQIFVDRLCYSVTKDFAYILIVVLTTEEGVELHNCLKANDDCIYIYGAGEQGERIGRIFSDINWSGYIDGVKEGQCNGRKIYRMHEISNCQQTNVLISCYFEAEIIKKQLMDCGFLPENIVVLNELDRRLEAKQYFEDFLNVKDGTMIDAGGYDGEEVIKYLRFVCDNNRKFYVFEPDANNFEKCKKKLQQYANGRIFNMALGDRECVMKFDQRGNTSSRFSENGIEEVKVTTVDALNEKVCFLKADVEGAEKEMLIGASETIKVYKPNLALSAYHKEEDIWELPQILLSLNPNYKFYIRHYNIGEWETVLYAVDDESKRGFDK